MAGSQDYLSERSRIKPLTAAELKKLIPEEVSGWKVVAEDQAFNHETIFDYIDGAGEVYRSYNFRLLLARRFHQPEKPDLVVDLFDMGTSYDAFGVFTHDRDGDKLNIGQMAVYKGGLLSFWKDRFFVSVYAEEETSETKEAVLQLGREIASRIKTEGKLPELVSLLPEEALEPETVRFFHTHHVLNYHLFVSDEDILGLGPETEAVLARYKRSGKAPVFLLFIRHPDEKETARAWKRFIKNYMPEARNAGEIRTEDGTWTVARFGGRILVVVFQAASKEEASRLIEEVFVKIKGK